MDHEVFVGGHKTRKRTDPGLSVHLLVERTQGNASVTEEDVPILYKILAKKGSLFQVEYIYTKGDGEPVGSEIDWVDASVLEETEEGFAALVKWNEKPGGKKEKVFDKSQSKIARVQERWAREEEEKKKIKATLIELESTSGNPTSNFQYSIDAKNQLDVVDLEMSIFRYFQDVLLHVLYSKAEKANLLKDLASPTLWQQPEPTLRSWVFTFKHNPKCLSNKFYQACQACLNNERFWALVTFYNHLIYLGPRVPYQIFVPAYLQQFNPLHENQTPITPSAAPIPTPTSDAQSTQGLENKLSLNLDIIRLIVDYSETEVLQCLRSVNRSWKSFLKPIIKQRPNRCILCNKLYSVYDDDHQQPCHYHPGHANLPKLGGKQDDQGVFHPQYLTWTCCNQDGLSSPCQTYRSHYYHPSRTWSFTPFEDDDERNYSVQLKTPSFHLNRFEINFYYPWEYAIREEDSYQLRKMLGAKNHLWSREEGTYYNVSYGEDDTIYWYSWKFIFDNELIPEMWKKHFDKLYFKVNPQTVTPIIGPPHYLPIYQKPKPKIVSEPMATRELTEQEQQQVVVGTKGVLVLTEEKHG